jgi:hypothetical protein
MVTIMKKAVFYSYVVIAVLVLSGGSGFCQDEAPANQPEKYYQYLPSDAIIVLTIPDMGELKALVERAEVQKAIDVLGVRGKLDEFIEEGEATFLKGAGVSLKKLYADLAGDITIAAMDIFSNPDNPEFAVFIGVSGGKTAIDAIMNTVVTTSRADDQIVETTEIAGHEVHQFQEDAFLCEFEGHIVFAPNRSTLVRVLTPGTRLIDDPRFQKHLDLTGIDTGIDIYVSLPPLVDGFMQAMDSMLGAPIPAEMEEKEGEATEEPEVTEDQEGMKEEYVDPETTAALMLIDELALDKLDSLSLHFPLSDDDAFKLYLHAPGYDGIIAKIIGSEPTGLEPAANVPGEVNVYSSFTIAAPVSIFDYFVSLASAIDSSVTPEVVMASLDGIKESTGIDIYGDLIEALGDNITFAVTVREPGPPSPAPAEEEGGESEFDKIMSVLSLLDIEILMEAKKSENLVRFFDSMGASTPGLLSEDYGDAKLFKVDGLPPNLNATIAIHNGFLRIGVVDAETMKARLDVINTPAALNQNADFVTAMKRVPESASGIVYANTSAKKNIWSIFSTFLLQEMDPETQGSFMEFSAMIVPYMKTEVSYRDVLPEGVFIYGEMNVMEMMLGAALHFWTYMTMGMLH